jgi:ABC-type uncharacterized transport system involved in gliding motility auxiliary subunit
MGRSSVLSGLLGLVLLVFAVIDYIAAPGFRFFFLVNLVGGVFAIIVWATSSRAALSSITGRRARYGTNAAVYSIAFVALLVAVNYISTRHYHRWDLTANKMFTLSPQSEKVLRTLKKPLKFYGFFAGGMNPQAEQLYESYAYASPMVTYQMVDPDKHPELAERYKVSVMNTTHIQYGSDATGNGTNVTDTNESAITNAIIRLTTSVRKVGCFAQDEGEPDIQDSQNAKGYGALATAMEGEGFDVKPVSLATLAKVPADCSILIVAGPTRPLLQHELDLIDGFLRNGGSVLMTLRPPTPNDQGAESGLVKLVADWGVQAGNDIIVDQVLRLFEGPALGLNPLVDLYSPHEITASFTQRTVWPMTRSVEPVKQPKQGLVVSWLAKTSTTSWAETDLKDLFEHQTAKFDASDRKGPITVADAVTGNLKTLGYGKSGMARLVVLGSTEIADNQYLDNFFNRDFFMNCLEWLSGQANSITIRPRVMLPSSFSLTVTQFAIVFALSVLLLPELLIILGIAVWWERRT